MSDLARFDSNLALIGDPEQMLKDSAKVAETLTKFVRDRKLTQKFGEREHLMIEAWLTLAGWFGVGVTCPQELTTFFEVPETGEEGYRAVGKLVRLQDGSLLGVEATAICTNFEENWGQRPKYKWENGVKKLESMVAVPRFQLLSMAQTRAASRACSMRYRNIVKIAGFETASAEEMTGTEKTAQAGGNGSNGTASANQEGPKKITDAQRKRIFGIANSKNVPMPEIVAILQKSGFKIAADVTVDKYDAVVKEIENWKVKA